MPDFGVGGPLGIYVHTYIRTYVHTPGGSIIVGEGFIRRFVYWFIRRQPVYP